jgi:lipoic acid synthetase
MKDLKSRNVSILTMGQYLQPSSRHLPVIQYVTPERFDWFAQVAKQIGLSFVVSGPMVRSSYRAGEFFLQTKFENISDMNHRNQDVSRRFPASGIS